MTQWEYSRVTRVRDADKTTVDWISPDGQLARLSGNDDVLVALNRFGSEGWELVAVTETQRDHSEAYHLKREVPDHPVRRGW